MDQQTVYRRRWAILGVLVLCVLVVIVDNTILNVALKTIQDDLDASQSEMQWAVDGYALVFAGLLITWGVLGDRWGRRRVLLFGMLSFGAMSAVCSLAATSAQLIGFRALMGIGAAAVQPQTLSIIQNIFAPKERAKAIGIWAGAAGMAIALGPITAGLLLKYFWWGSIFLVNVPIVIVAVVGIVVVVPESRDSMPGRLDPLAVVLSVAALVVLVYGVIEGGNTNDWLAWNAAGAIGLGAGLLALFVWTQARSAHPMVDVSLFRNRHFSSGAFAIAMTFFALQGATFYLAYYLQAVRGYSPLLAGTALVAVAAAVMIAAPMSTKLSAAVGQRVVTGTGLLVFGGAMGAYALATQTMPVWVVELILVAFGLGMGLTMSPATDAIMSAVPREKSGAGSAVNNTVRQVAGALGVAVLGSIVAVVFRNHLGAQTPAHVAARLDRPAVVAALPADERVSPLVTRDTSQSIGNALHFAGAARDALQARAGSVPPAQAAQFAARARSELSGFVSSSKASFMSAMHLTSLFAALAAVVGAIAAFRFMPGRRPSSTPPADAPAAVPVEAAA